MERTLTYFVVLLADPVESECYSRYGLVDQRVPVGEVLDSLYVTKHAEIDTTMFSNMAA